MVLPSRTTMHYITSACDDLYSDRTGCLPVVAHAGACKRGGGQAAGHPLDFARRRRTSNGRLPPGAPSAAGTARRAGQAEQQDQGCSAKDATATAAAVIGGRRSLNRDLGACAVVAGIGFVTRGARLGIDGEVARGNAVQLKRHTHAVTGVHLAES